MRRLGVAPLYQKIDLTRGGGIYMKEVSDDAYLHKVSTTIHEEFHEKDFKAETAIVVTFDDVIQINQQDDLVICLQLVKKHYNPY